MLDPDKLRLVVDDRRVLLQRSNVIFWLYAVQGYATKPYVAVLRGPSGRNVLEDSPADHVHHHGIWWGHGDVNGVDFYLEVAPDAGLIVQTSVDVIDDAPRWGFASDLEWRAPSGEVLIGERRSLLLHARDETHYTLDCDSTYTMRVDAAFGDTKESVMPGLRVAEALTPVCGGAIRNSEGGVGEADCMGKPAAWLDYSAPRTAMYGLAEVTDGITTMSHPSNDPHPPVFFARDYGPSSPWQGNHFTGPSSHAAGSALRARHRFLVHDGSVDLAAAYDTYVKEMR